MSTAHALLGVAGLPLRDLPLCLDASASPIDLTVWRQPSTLSFPLEVLFSIIGKTESFMTRSRTAELTKLDDLVAIGRRDLVEFL